MKSPHQPDDPGIVTADSDVAAATLAAHVASVASVLAAHVATVAAERKMETKEMVKEALKEWLDEKFQAFGKWSMTSIAASGFVALAYFIIYVHGWRAPR